MERIRNLERIIKAKKLKCSLNLHNIRYAADKIYIEVWFSKYTDANEALAYFNSIGINNSGRQTNASVNAYFIFKTLLTL